ncbi:HAMP domain-containing sensor histidine kinase [Viridibacillus sp. NPDC096237]|uniref:HAMP domain-containing sensor histidine kinase n=1 Tax=Viridibacillus sp. NPDC096237 TaxID=3390721 RepID=UPI003CFEAE41
MKFKNSLLMKYLTFILIAIIILPLTLPIVSITTNLLSGGFNESKQNIYQNGTDIEAMWNREAKALSGTSDEFIEKSLLLLQKEYNQASIYWVDETNQTRLKPSNLNIPSTWSAAYTVDFMKKNRGYQADPFTVVAFIGEDQNKGFMVIQVPRSAMQTKEDNIRDTYSYLIVIGILTILASFILLSWIFFYRIRKRLLYLQKAMDSPTESGFPNRLEVGKVDEIGQLEQAFNKMIIELELSRKREQDEEKLRRQLIANLSHDLRTPLTAMQSHLYRMSKENLIATGQKSLEMVDEKIHFLDQLIENLLSYTLLSSRKYPFNPSHTDIVRLIRTSVAMWYPVFENRGFTIDLEIPDQSVHWYIDPGWFERILNNLFQNINRHASAGKYVGIHFFIKETHSYLQISDHGTGIDGVSEEKGAGIGLSIVDLMVKEMELDLNIKSNENGTSIFIYSH